MDYEKAYKEALERAKQIQSTPYTAHWDIMKEVCEELFPELAESENERMLNAIIKFTKGSPFLNVQVPTGTITKEEMVAWLEKQGKENPLKGTLGDVFDDLKFGLDPSPKQGEQKPEWSEKDKAMRDFIIRIMEVEHPHGVFKVGSFYKFFNKDYISVDEIISWLKSLCPATEAEIESNSKKHKFKVGDWVVYQNDTFQVQSLSNGTLILQGEKYQTYFIEELCRLWTIKDAKDGDVLCDYIEENDNPLIFILKKFERVNFGLAKPSDYSSYCFLTAGDRQRFKEGKYHHKHNIKPATKEQRDTLMKAMTDAGYIFDIERKELKKIEQKPAEWSDEDEEMIDSIIGNIKYLYSLGSCDEATVDMKVNWLKSLRPQNRWMPSDEQIKVLNEVINFAADHGTMRWNDYIYNVLKSLREQLKKLTE